MPDVHTNALVLSHFAYITAKMTAETVQIKGYTLQGSAAKPWLHVSFHLPDKTKP